MSEASTMRPGLICVKLGSAQADTHVAAPATMASQRMLRPWNRRAAFQIMPQETNSKAVGKLAGMTGIACVSALHSATENPPVR